MSKKRTKQQKIRAQYHYALPVSRSFSGISSIKDERAKEEGRVFEKENDATSLYAYDPLFTRRDIIRTLIVSAIILSLQFALYWWWK